MRDGGVRNKGGLCDFIAIGAMFGELDLPCSMWYAALVVYSPRWAIRGEIDAIVSVLYNNG